jgi:hypothetical protein
LVVRVQRVFGENLFVCGADRICDQLNREDIRIARFPIERLVRAGG